MSHVLAEQDALAWAWPTGRPGRRAAAHTTLADPHACATALAAEDQPSAEHRRHVARQIARTRRLEQSLTPLRLAALEIAAAARSPASAAGAGASPIAKRLASRDGRPRRQVDRRSCRAPRGSASARFVADGRSREPRSGTLRQRVDIALAQQPRDGGHDPARASSPRDAGSEATARPPGRGAQRRGTPGTPPSR